MFISRDIFDKAWNQVTGYNSQWVGRIYAYICFFAYLFSPIVIVVIIICILDIESKNVVMQKEHFVLRLRASLHGSRFYRHLVRIQVRTTFLYKENGHLGNHLPPQPVPTIPVCTLKHHLKYSNFHILDPT